MPRSVKYHPVKPFGLSEAEVLTYRKITENVKKNPGNPMRNVDRVTDKCRAWSTIPAQSLHLRTYLMNWARRIWQGPCIGTQPLPWSGAGTMEPAQRTVRTWQRFRSVAEFIGFRPVTLLGHRIRVSLTFGVLP